uniref:Fucose kinase n=1 Tax=Takifugu rubripes TaxID=31033 RepID=A0A674MS94_TAKRU
MFGGSGFRWTVVVLTCQHKDSVYSFHRELELRQQRGSLPQDMLIATVTDREQPLGSGGATLNALLVAVEHLSNRAGHTVVTADVLHDAHILILHTGRDFPWSSCSRAFCWLAVENPDQSIHAPVCCVDLLLNCLNHQVCPGSPPGVWVCSTDMILTIPPDFVMSWEGFSGARALALPGDISYALSHGVYLSDKQGHVRDIIYRGTEDQLRPALMPDGKVPLVSGPVFFSSLVSEKLLRTHVTPPLDGCTYLGLDSGAPPLQVSLFLDVLKCLCSDVTQDQFVREERTGCSSPVGPQGETVRQCREELWRILRGTPLTVAYVPDGCYDYLNLSGKRHVERLSQNCTDGNVLSHIQKVGGVNPGASIINSVLDGDVTVATGAVVQHCHLKGPLKVPTGCLLSGLNMMTLQCPLWQLDLASDIIIQGRFIELGELKLKVFTVMGAQDDLESSFDDARASFLNQSWNHFCSRTGIQPEELWVKKEQRSLLEARLFPVFSPKGGAVGLEGGVGWLLGGSGSLQMWKEAWKLSLKEVMALTHQEAELQWREELLYLAGRRRVCDALCNGTNVCLLPCFRAAVLGGQHKALLETLDNIAAGCGEQEVESLEELGLAARCLTCIADVLVGMAGGKGGLRSGPAANKAWSSAYLLLEKDLSGGVQALAAQRENWLSRPDLLVRAARHYEGASQVLLRKAVMSSHRFISIGQGELPPLEEWHKVECPARLDLAGALLKAVCVYSGLVSLSSSQSLRDQLMDCWGGGLELHSWSLLPTGSGLGTSSILAGALLAAVYRCTGRTYDTDSLIHAVLQVEQVLTTGGGWQDQVGGLVGGIMVGRSRASLPLRVEVECLRPPEDFLASLEQHLLLVYTGKTRLARNLLQDVVRSWYSRLPAIVQNAHDLVANAEQCAKACLEGSLSRLGACLDQFWRLKKVMAPGCEPASVKTMMEALKPLVLGQTLAGAGGGGFLCVLTREPQQREKVLQVLNNTPGLGDFSIHYVEVDMDGISASTPGGY